MEEKKIYTIEDEIDDIFQTNLKMLQEEGIIYVLDFRCITSHQFDTARFEGNERELYVKKIYPYVLSPEYRAKQRLLYEQLPIFHGLLPLIDEALQSFYEGKYICAYTSLVPVIEGLLFRWSGKKWDDAFDFRKFIKSKTHELENARPDDPWGKHNLRLLRRIITGFFFNPSSEASVNSMFNRNVVSHLVNDPEYLQSQKNTLRLLTIIDLIAPCYTYDFRLEGGGVIKVSNNHIIHCHKYLEEGQERIKKITDTYYDYNAKANRNKI